uniref:Uncharacterized protein n=1 Tax=Rhizophora mucronata TaxID=61149 RepID=A0A2P2LM50_RHIMU
MALFGFRLQKFCFPQYHTTQYHVLCSIFVNITKICTGVTAVCWRQTNTSVGLSCIWSTMTKTILHDCRQCIPGNSKPGTADICIPTINPGQFNLLLKKLQASFLGITRTTVDINYVYTTPNTHTQEKHLLDNTWIQLFLHNSIIVTLHCGVLNFYSTKRILRKLNLLGLICTF